MNAIGRLIGALVITMLACGGGAGAGATAAPGAQETTPTPILIIQGVVEHTDGTTAGMSASYQIAEGPGPYTLVLDADPASCRVATSRRAGVAPWATWRLDVRPVSTADEQATVDVTWSRTITEHGDVVSESEEVLRLVLTPGRPTPLDIVNAPAQPQGTCRRFLVELGVQIGEDTAQSVLAYDVWLVQHDGEGRERVQRQQTNGLRAAQTPFIFAPTYFRRDGAVVEGRDAGAFSTGVSGNVRGRIRADGSFALSLETTSGVATTDGPGGVSWGGVKELRVQPGETIEVAIPPMTDRLSQLDPDGRIGVAGFASALQRQSTSIRITTTRLR